ncbi:MAG: fumarate reductase subunit C [Candidatus Binataceae bacterium]|nr:fumarate reductase subunit C [Candidatus Binataceae bacterium]
MANAIPQSKTYRPSMPMTWWLERWNYTWFILRELSSAFVAYWVVITLLQIAAISAGPVAYTNFRVWMSAPYMVAINIITFIFVIFHTLSWFRLVPQAMLPRIGGKRTSTTMTSAPMYAVWVVVSVIVGLFIMGILP